jgi:CRAL/TRIO domain
MEGIEVFLQSEFPEATEAEVKRFVRACSGNNKTPPGQVKRDAEQALESYLDWRSCYGLDYAGQISTGSDAEDWTLAMDKSLEVTASMRQTQELAKKFEEEQAKKEAEITQQVTYDVDTSDSQGSEEKVATADNVEEKAEEAENVSVPAQKMSDDQMKEQLQQIIYQHTDKDGKPVTDKEGGKILHVLPALINRQVAQADFYALVLSFYLDRKFDRSSDEKMTVVVDVRAGEGWPNPVAFMMVKFVRTITKELQARYPERLKSLVVYPVPWAAMGVWTAIKRVFGFDTARKVTLVSGPADSAAALPKGELEGLIDGDVLDMMEHFRLKLFQPIRSPTVTD